jgi:hypothetical protein
LLQQIVVRHDCGRRVDQRAQQIERQFWQRKLLAPARDFGFADVDFEVTDSIPGWRGSVARRQWWLHK